MGYTINKLAKLAGVSVRTLHYYDEIGLLKPSFIKNNGYRYYEDKELIKLQQILFFRELEFPLEDIKKILSSPHFNRVEVLRQQRSLLKLKRERIDKLLITIDKAINSDLQKIGGESMNTDDLFAAFGDEELVKNMKEAKVRWGNTDAYKQSMRKVKGWTKKDYERIKKEGEEFTKKLADAMDKEINSREVQELIKQHHQGIEYFYDCSIEMYRNLGEMYVSDPRFAKYYNKFRPGLAVWLRDAINYYCDNN